MIISLVLLPVNFIVVILVGKLAGLLLTKDNDDRSLCTVIGLVLALVSTAILSIASGTKEYEAALSVELGFLLVLVLLSIAYFVNHYIDVKKTIDKRVQEEIKKRHLENDIILKKAGIL